MSKRLGAAIAIAVVLAACSSGSNNKTITSALEACTAEANAVVDKMAGCVNLAPAVVTAMKSDYARSCAAVDQAVKAKRMSYDAAKGTACVKAVQAISDCATVTWIGDSSSALEQLFPECKGVLSGAVAVGGECASGQCANGWCDESACPGKCAALVAEGGSCAQAVDSCAAGTKCYPNGSPTATCKAVAAAGQACDTAPCADGLYCGNDFKCTALGNLGETCMNGLFNSCKPGLYCESTTIKCAAAVQTSGPCPSGDGCAAGYSCSFAADRVCKKIGGLGDACVAGEHTCGGGYRCDSSTEKCAAQPALGQECDVKPTSDDSRICVYSSCNAGTCVAFKAAGATCDPLANNNHECGYDAYCDGTTNTCKKFHGDVCQAQQ